MFLLISSQNHIVILLLKITDSPPLLSHDSVQLCGSHMNMIPYGRGRGTRRTDLRGRDGGKMHKYPLEAARAVLDLHVLDLCTGDPLTGLMHSLTHVQRRVRRRGHRAPTARVLLRAPISLAPARPQSCATGLCLQEARGRPLFTTPGQPAPAWRRRPASMAGDAPPRSSPRP